MFDNKTHPQKTLSARNCLGVIAGAALASALIFAPPASTFGCAGASPAERAEQPVALIAADTCYAATNTANSPQSNSNKADASNEKKSDKSSNDLASNPLVFPLLIVLVLAALWVFMRFGSREHWASTEKRYDEIKEEAQARARGEKPQSRQSQSRSTFQINGSGRNNDRPSGRPR